MSLVAAGATRSLFDPDGDPDGLICCLNQTRDYSTAGRPSKRHAPSEKVAKHRSDVLARVERNKLKSKDLICPIQFDNQLPPVPFPPKFLAYPLPADRSYRFDLSANSLEASYKFELHEGPQTCVPINVIDPREYHPPTGGQPNLHPDDQAIISEEYAEPFEKIPVHKVRDVDESWLPRAQLSHNDLSDKTYKLSNDLEEQKRLLEERQREALAEEATMPVVDRIIASFDAVSDDAVLESEGLKPETAWSVLPDVERWPQKFVHVRFAHAPTDVKEREEVFRLPGEPEEEANRIAKSLIWSTGGQSEALVSTLLVPDSVPAPGQPLPENTPFRAVREYAMDALPVPENEQSIVLIWDNERRAVYYSHLLAHAEMSAHSRKKAGAAGGSGEQASDKKAMTDVVLESRDLEDIERDNEHNALKLLLPED